MSRGFRIFLLVTLGLPGLVIILLFLYLLTNPETGYVYYGQYSIRNDVIEKFCGWRGGAMMGATQGEFAATKKCLLVK